MSGQMLRGSSGDYQADERAGVAVITSHVVKKNQVENGFEDIKCTIGGQNVAEWGDQFRVGIQ